LLKVQWYLRIISYVLKPIEYKLSHLDPLCCTCEDKYLAREDVTKLLRVLPHFCVGFVPSMLEMHTMVVPRLK
jgi:hypothetical protein